MCGACQVERGTASCPPLHVLSHTHQPREEASVKPLRHHTNTGPLQPPCRPVKQGTHPKNACQAAAHNHQSSIWSHLQTSQNTHAALEPHINTNAPLQTVESKQAWLLSVTTGTLYPQQLLVNTGTPWQLLQQLSTWPDPHLAKCILQTVAAKRGTVKNRHHAAGSAANCTRGLLSSQTASSSCTVPPGGPLEHTSAQPAPLTGCRWTPPMHPHAHR